MRSTVEPLEGNKVKLSVEVDEDEFENALDAAFRRIAAEVRIPGFRPGKAPRRLLEARIGAEAAREEALRAALPDYYARALKDSEVDAIAPPEIDITSGQETGAVSFSAVVEVRPEISVPGYSGLQVSVPRPEPSDEEIDAQIDRLRRQDGVLEPVNRPARDGDHVTIDRRVYRHDETLQQAEDELYEVGSGTMVPELDEQLRGSKVGDILKFNAAVAEDAGGDVSFQVLVKDVKEMKLPEVTDEWASEASEFDTVDELRADLRKRMTMVRQVQARLAMRDEVIKALVELVEDDAPEPLIGAEMERRLHDFAHRLQSQGVDLAEYLQATGTSQEQLIDELRQGAVEGVKADLALRAVAEAEAIEVTDDDLDAEIAAMAERMGRKPAQLRRELDRVEQVPEVRSSLRKAKALEWLLDNVEVVDEEGRPIDRADLEPPQLADEDEAAHESEPRDQEAQEEQKVSPA